MIESSRAPMAARSGSASSRHCARIRFISQRQKIIKISSFSKSLGNIDKINSNELEIKADWITEEETKGKYMKRGIKGLRGRSPPVCD